MNTLLTLMKREYWENRGSFFKAPAVFAGFILLASICYLILFFKHAVHYDINVHIDALSSVPPTLTQDIFYGMSLPFMIILWLIAFNYFLKCLFDDRKDRSLLFWQSMPIAEWETILSKTLAGTLIISLCTWVCIVITEFIFLIIVTIAASSAGLGSIGNLWNPLAIIAAWMHILGALCLQALWLFPLFAWCMLSSAYAKKSPFLTAIIPILCIFIVEMIFLHHGIVGKYVFSRIHLAIGTWHNLFIPLQQYSTMTDSAPEVAALHHYLSNHTYDYISLYWSLAIGVIFMAIAGYLRYANFRSDD